ncbi:zinc-ribbon domain-containing protein, partial [Escherichia coli]
MHCPHCNKELPDGAAFCSGCGQKTTPAPSAASTAPTCWECHSPLRGNASFCSHCGSKQPQ